MRERIQRFMYGRYGVDDFNNFLMFFTLGLLIISLFIRNNIFNILVFAAIIYYYMRMMSKNHSKRFAENQKFLAIRGKLLAPFQKQHTSYVRNKGYKIFTCPSCKQKIRIPKGKGKISITCPKCHEEFIKRT